MIEGRYSLRRLGADDIEPARRLNALFGTAFGEPDTYEGDPPSRDYLVERLAREHVIALVALSGEEVVGGLVAYALDKLERARSEIYIYDLAVAEAHRRRGIATALIGRCRDIAAERGAWVIYVQADYEDAPAVALYEKMGRREEVLHYDIEVERPASP
ncbi:MAG TPA: AAC(3)-I family aminoglycoside N-acetyltransferase [Allosphingosinicella sp.]|jgi:aminoglycoside 3-N-acetyltransferase I